MTILYSNLTYVGGILTSQVIKQPIRLSLKEFDDIYNLPYDFFWYSCFYLLLRKSNLWRPFSFQGGRGFPRYLSHSLCGTPPWWLEHKTIGGVGIIITAQLFFHVQILFTNF